MSSLQRANLPPDQTAEPVHVSTRSLSLGCVGFALFGLGTLTLALEPQGTTLNWGLRIVGLICLSVAVLLHVDHLSYRIGRPAVYLMIAGVTVQALRCVPFIFLPSAFSSSGWVTFYYTALSLSFVLFGLGLLMVAVHKRTQLSSASGPADATESVDSSGSATRDVTVHASYLSLISAAVGCVIQGAAYFQFGGSQFSWAMLLVGPLLIAVGLISHIDHLTARIGRAAVVLGIIAVVLIAMAPVPFVIDPANYVAPSWNSYYWACWSFGFLSAALSCAFVGRHKAQV